MSIDEKTAQLAIEAFRKALYEDKHSRPAYVIDECVVKALEAYEAAKEQPDGKSLIEEMEELLKEPVNTEKGSAGYWTNFGISLAIEIARKRKREDEKSIDCRAVFEDRYQHGIGDPEDLERQKNNAWYNFRDGWNARYPAREVVGEWTAWTGGECPISKYSIVEVDLRDTPIPFIGYAITWHWQHSLGKGDILRYRILHEKPEEQGRRGSDAD